MKFRGALQGWQWQHPKICFFFSNTRRKTVRDAETHLTPKKTHWTIGSTSWRSTVPQLLKMNAAPHVPSTTVCRIWVSLLVLGGLILTVHAKKTEVTLFCRRYSITSALAFEYLTWGTRERSGCSPAALGPAELHTHPQAAFPQLASRCREARGRLGLHWAVGGTGRGSP